MTTTQWAKFRNRDRGGGSGGHTRTYARSKFRLNNPHFINKVGKARANGLRSMGAYVRTVARNSIKFKADPEDASPPGKPPHSHSQNRIRSIKNIQYDYYPHIGGVYVGAVFLKRGNNSRGKPVPHIHEHSPMTVTLQKRYVSAIRGKKRPPPKRMRQKGIKKVKAKGEQRRAYLRLLRSGAVSYSTYKLTARYRMRNFMKPALKRARPKLAEVFSRGFRRTFNGR